MPENRPDRDRPDDAGDENRERRDELRADHEAQRAAHRAERAAEAAERAAERAEREADRGGDRTSGLRERPDRGTPSGGTPQVTIVPQPQTASPAPTPSGDGFQLPLWLIVGVLVGVVAMLVLA